jgi:hypothetical protein
MTWEQGHSYEVEAEGFGEAQTLTYLGEINLSWTFERVHVFEASDQSLVGLRDEDIEAATTVT